MTIADNGWDSRAWLDGDWLHREPRREAVRPRLLAEARLLPWLAPQLPLPVPIPEPTQYGVRHLLLVGDPLEDDASTALGRDLGTFLQALHAVDPAEAVAHGALDAATAEADKTRFLDEARAQVLPLLPAAAQPAAADLLSQVGTGARNSLIHSDLAPEHVLVSDARITGIIDWTDAEIGDPAVDLCWLLNDAPTALAEGVEQTYNLTPELRHRAHDWHRLGPWYGVHRGLLLNLPKDVEEGITAILTRL